MSEIDLHPSVGDANLMYALADSLRVNGLDPKLLYVTFRQVDLWRNVHRQHSPIHGNPEFARIYRESFSRVTEMMPSKDVWLIGLGSGTGRKEADLCAELIAHGHRVTFSAVDVSRDLVEQANEKVAGVGGEVGRGLVCDLGEIEFLAQWLAKEPQETTRLFTFFGLVPNFSPGFVAKLLRAVLRPDDLLLVNAHLVPVGDGLDFDAAMKKVRPQYDNPETLAWLGETLRHWQLAHKLKPPMIMVGDAEGVPAFLGVAQWRNDEYFEMAGDVFSMPLDRPLQIFRSLRYTPSSFEDLLRRAGFNFERLAITACREEAIWAVR